ncbi:MAG: right-handed parallel beta-helix repeat-containing protein [Desulfobacterales bacterium]
MISAFSRYHGLPNNVIRWLLAGVSAFVSDDPATIASLSGDIRITANRIHNNPTGLRFAAEGGVIENNYFLNNNRAMDVQTRSNDLTIRNNTVVSSAPELFGTGSAWFLMNDQTASRRTSGARSQAPLCCAEQLKSARTAFVASDPQQSGKIAV